jgi:hypothetical protein
LSATGASSYTWTPSGTLNNSTNANVVATPTQTTTYAVTGTNTCGTANANVTITVNPSPTIPVISQSGSSLSITLAGGETAQWFLNGNPISGATGASINANAPGNYTVSVTNSSGCSRSSIAVQIEDTTSVDEINSLQELIIFPNPTSGEFTIQWAGIQDQISIEIVDLLGKKLFETNANGSDNSVVVSDNHFSAGVYIVHLKQNMIQVSKKITIRP